MGADKSVTLGDPTEAPKVGVLRCPITPQNPLACALCGLRLNGGDPLSVSMRPSSKNVPADPEAAQALLVGGEARAGILCHAKNESSPRTIYYINAIKVALEGIAGNTAPCGLLYSDR